jgi:hypothetical protein
VNARSVKSAGRLLARNWFLVIVPIAVATMFVAATGHSITMPMPLYLALIMAGVGCIAYQTVTTRVLSRRLVERAVQMSQMATALSTSSDLMVKQSTALAAVNHALSIAQAELHKHRADVHGKDWVVVERERERIEESLIAALHDACTEATCILDRPEECIKRTAPTP